MEQGSELRSKWSPASPPGMQSTPAAHNNQQLGTPSPFVPFLFGFTPHLQLNSNAGVLYCTALFCAFHGPGVQHQNTPWPCLYSVSTESTQRRALCGKEHVQHPHHSLRPSSWCLQHTVIKPSSWTRKHLREESRRAQKGEQVGEGGSVPGPAG